MLDLQLDTVYLCRLHLCATVLSKQAAILAAAGRAAPEQNTNMSRAAANTPEQHVVSPEGLVQGNCKHVLSDGCYGFLLLSLLGYVGQEVRDGAPQGQVITRRDNDLQVCQRLHHLHYQSEA